MRVLPDNNDVVVWLLNESATPFVNSSTSGSSLGATANLVTQIGTVVTGQLSLFGQSCVYFPSFGNYPAGASATHNRIETVSGSTALNVPFPLSISGWFKVRSYVNLSDNYGFLMMKRYRGDGSWNPPYTTMDFTMWNSADGTCRWDLTTGAANNQLLQNVTDFPIPLGQWSHLGWTFDGLILRAYLNGLLAGTLEVASGPAPVDYGTNGPWVVGATPESDGNKQEGCFAACDIRIANIVRPPSYFANIYQQGALAY